MACNRLKSKTTVLLGYEDEPVTDANASALGYWTNKIGGLPDWCVEGVVIPKCQLCHFPQLLVVQIYAPLENSYYHRTLYVFCCINTNCWNRSQSWTCLRSQLEDERSEAAADAMASRTVNLDWCSGADNWGDVEDDDNGNEIPTCSTAAATANTDSDDSSSLTNSFGALNVDQCNANFAHRPFGAFGKASPTAEIEGDESEVVTIDTPTAPQRDLLALLNVAAPPPDITTSTAFVPSYMWVCEEGSSGASERENKMLEDYVARHGEIKLRPCDVASRNEASALEEDERYEKTVPLHGDAMFHEFVTVLQENPGHILRYSRSSSPLLMAPLEPPQKCRYCQGPLVFELQIMPTMLTKLRLPGDDDYHVEFGNVVVYACKGSCWSPGDVTREEAICVQAESA